ncbi:hypothetical protein NA56DRAFT_657007 [Hyaloscypha hepaticicola]|uniref:Uncharacterized protein n=1 Tax=Hyaloscypha hepaticicola TaxID=2082293 RepID=A0A2J6QBV3_9HELO|nr:hypothetical protein NA56DRAFT_657007 [Hyaloscypha hepaticicola]
MAKTTTKRKSESALPTGKSKQRKTTTSRRQDSETSQRDDDSSDPLFIDEQPLAPKHVKKAATKARKSEPIMRVTKADEYEEDEGRMQSSQFLALVEFQTKKKRKAVSAAKEYMEKFTNSVNNAEQALKKNCDTLNAASAKLDNNFLEAFTRAYAVSRPTAPPSDENYKGKSSSSDSFAIRYERSKEIITVARNVIEKFEKANEKTVKINVAGFMANDWQEENSTAEKVIAAGRITGLQKYEALAEGAGEPEIEEDMVLFAEAIYKPEQEIHGPGWGRMARKQEKAFKKLDKAFGKETVV